MYRYRHRMSQSHDMLIYSCFNNCICLIHQGGTDLGVISIGVTFGGHTNAYQG